MKIYMTRKELLLLSAAGALSSVFPAGTNADNSTNPEGAGLTLTTSRASLFAPSDIRITGGQFLRNQHADANYLKQLEPDRMLSWMRKNVGLEPKAEAYGGWDTGGSFIIGHYLSAVSQMAVATDDSDLRKRSTYVVSDMAQCQIAGGDGGLYSFSGDRVWFHNVQQGVIRAANTTPWYVTHKTMAGLRDAWFLCKNEQARDVLIEMCDWCVEVTSGLTHDQWQKMLGPPELMGEFGGPNEILVDVYSLTRDEKYLDCARKFKHDIVFDAVAAGDLSVLAGKHANTEVPKFIGYQRTYDATGEAVWHTASVNFWKEVVDRYTWPNGGAGQWEHFQPINDTSIYQDCGPETCVSYNMLKLTRQLWANNPLCSYIAYYERTLYNSILPSETLDGGFVYYTSMRPGHYRVFSRPYDAFWCCVGTGMENHAQLGLMIYGRDNNRLYVNLFITSTLNWREQSATIQQETTFPEAPESRISIRLPQPKEFTISVRKPEWSDLDDFKIKINGKPIAVKAAADGYVNITRIWKNYDLIEVELAPRIYAEESAGGSFASFYYGPVLLAGALGDSGLVHADFYGGGNNTNVTNQLAVNSEPLTNFPGLSAASEAVASDIHLSKEGAAAFAAEHAFTSDNVTLRPLYDLAFQRYTVLWPTERYYAKQRFAIEQIESKSIDHVIVGDGHSEEAHHLNMVGSSTGFAGQGPCRAWRDATGWFSYDMAVSPSLPVGVRCVYWGADSGRTFRILVDDTVISTVNLVGGHNDSYISAVYPIPLDITKGRTQVTVKFDANGSQAGGVFDVRTIKA